MSFSEYCEPHLFSVSGCPDPPTPKGGWMERREDYVLVGCSSAENKATAKLTCKDKRWIGDTPDCTSGNDTAFFIPNAF